MDPRQNEMYLVSLIGYEYDVQALALFGPGTLEVARRAVEDYVKGFGVPEPWIGFKVERFVGGVAHGSISYNADCEPHSIPDWREPGACEWKWDELFEHEAGVLELAIALRTAGELAVFATKPPGEPGADDGTVEFKVCVGKEELQLLSEKAEFEQRMVGDMREIRMVIPTPPLVPLKSYTVKGQQARHKIAKFVLAMAAGYCRMVGLKDVEDVLFSIGEFLVGTRRADWEEVPDDEKH